MKEVRVRQNVSLITEVYKQEEITWAQVIPYNSYRFFLENREGRLEEVLDVLAKSNVNIVALSLADTSDYGMLRMIVSDPHKGRMALKEVGITSMLTDVVALRVPHATGSLSKAMHQIVDGEVNIEYMYAFANGDDAAAVLKSDDPARVIDILKGSGFDVYSADEAYRANQ